jgi:hypothetical protein
MQPRPLAPLRIPTGWKVAWNDLLELDFESGELCEGESIWDLKEDLLLLEHQQRGIIIDLGWYPSFNSMGSFRLVAVRIASGEADQPDEWARPIRKHECRSFGEVRETLESWLADCSLTTRRPDGRPL